MLVGADSSNKVRLAAALQYYFLIYLSGNFDFQVLQSL